MSAINPVSGFRPVTFAATMRTQAKETSTGNNGAKSVELPETAASGPPQAVVQAVGADGVASTVGSALLKRTYAAAGLDPGPGQATVDHLR